GTPPSRQRTTAPGATSAASASRLGCLIETALESTAAQLPAKHDSRRPSEGVPKGASRGFKREQRQVIPELAARGFRALSFDLPGLGFADRPSDFDYTFTGLGRFAVAAVDVLGLDRFHLVVHDAGGPVGFELAAAIPNRVRSLTLLNTVVDMNTVPFPMEIYARAATGNRWPALPPVRITRELIYLIGIRNRAAVPSAEGDAYRELVLRIDNGRAYLRIMRNLERTADKARQYKAVVDTRQVAYPVQIVGAPMIRSCRCGNMAGRRVKRQD
ncbi:MAG TPA: alpha/beta fold hydrolase, partial [Croceibacterium sp.]